MLRSSFYNSIMFIVLALSYNIFKGILPTAALARRACAKNLTIFFSMTLNMFIEEVLRATFTRTVYKFVNKQINRNKIKLASHIEMFSFGISITTFEYKVSK